MEKKVDLELLLKKPIEDCNQEELKLRLQVLEKKLQDVTKQIFIGDTSQLQPDDMVEIDMPLGPLGDQFKINEQPYVGLCRVKLRTAQQLAMMVSNAYSREREKHMSRTNVFETANINAQDLVKIRRFEQIMGDSNG